MNALDQYIAKREEREAAEEPSPSTYKRANVEGFWSDGRLLFLIAASWVLLWLLSLFPWQPEPTDTRYQEPASEYENQDHRGFF